MQMKRPGFERIKRRTHIRLALEHLEQRRLMAGLNVLVFTDQDGSRSLSPSVDAPAPNRLVYVDLNRDFGFDDGEPLAVSGDDGIARFPGLAAGDYLIGLAANNAAQILTTSVIPDRSARTVAASPGVPLTSLITSPDLKHGWSVTGSGVLTPVGADDSGRALLNLNGRVLGVTSGTSGDNSAWALVDQGQAQPTLYGLDFQTGAARMTSVQGVSNSQRISGIARAGSQVYLQLTNADATYVAELRASQSGVSIGQPSQIPAGTLVGSSADDRLALLSSRSRLGSEDQLQGAKVSVVQIRGSTIAVDSLELEESVTSLSYSADGQLLFAALEGGGVNVFTTSGGLKSAAQLAEATGPVSAGLDGRFVTANSSKADELIVWDSRTWTPTGRVQLPAGQGAVISLAVDSFGDRILAATAVAALTARLSNPAPQAVSVAGRGVTDASLGVRLIDRPVPLPVKVEVTESTDEDVLLSFDLSNSSAVQGLGAGLFFAPGTGTSLGTLQVTATGKVTYRTQANANGADSAMLRVFDGINTTTLVLSLDVRAVNDAPTSFVVDPTIIDEAASAGVVAGVATVFDVDSDAQYEITTSDARFVVVDGQVMLTQSESLDFETESSIELEITATDLDNPAFVITRRISIPVRDNNDAPTAVSLGSPTIIENQGGSVVGQVEVSDPDGHGEYTYSVSDERFEFESGALRLKSGVVLDYETEPAISLTVTFSDSTVAGQSKSVSSEVTVHVVDSNDAPTSLSVAAHELRSGEKGAVVGRVNVSDPDSSDEYSFNVSDARFVVDGSILRLRDDQSISREQEAVVTMMVTVTDRGGAVLAETVTLNVVNDAPFQNPRDPFDVDNDGHIYPRDALILVNELNSKGSHILTATSASGEGGDVFFPDVNGDGILTPLDALILINRINRGPTPAINNGNGTTGTGTDPDAESKVPEDPDENPDTTTSQLAEGEGPTLLPSNACQPWLASSDVQEQARRDAIDSELEQLVEELSRARLS